MSVALFHQITTGVPKNRFNVQSQPIINRTELGRYLGIIDIRHNFKDFTRTDIDIGGGSTSSLGRLKSPHDIFIGLDDGIKLAIRSNEPKVATPVKWLTKNSVQKIVEERQRAIKFQQTILVYDNHIDIIQYENIN